MYIVYCLLTVALVSNKEDDGNDDGDADEADGDDEEGVQQGMALQVTTVHWREV